MLFRSARRARRGQRWCTTTATVVTAGCASNHFGGAGVNRDGAGATSMNTGKIDLARVIGILVVAAGSLALAGVVIGGPLGRGLDVAAIVALAIAPGARVLVLMVTWSRARDIKYAAAALILVLLVAASVIGALTWR